MMRARVKKNPYDYKITGLFLPDVYTCFYLCLLLQDGEGIVVEWSGTGDLGLRTN